MNLKERIVTDLKQGMKKRDRERVGVLRMLKARILEREVELRSEKGREHSLTDEEVLQVLATYAKQRRQSIESYREASRNDLAEREEKELEIVNSYLPEPLSDEDVQEIVAQVIAETGAASPADMGQVMKQVMPRVQGRADGKRVSRIVREKLSG